MTVPRNTPPRRPSVSSLNSVGAHAIAYGPSTRGVVTACDTCSHALSASGSKNAFSTRLTGAAMAMEMSSEGGDAGLDNAFHHTAMIEWRYVAAAARVSGRAIHGERRRKTAQDSLRVHGTAPPLQGTENPGH